MSIAAEATGLVLHFLDALGGEDVAWIAHHVGDDFENRHLSALGEDSNGKDAYVQRLPGFLADFADRLYLVEEMVHDVDDTGATVVVRYRFEATHQGVALAVPGIAWFRVEDGRISRRIDSWDSLTVLRQIDEAPEG